MRKTLSRTSRAIIKQILDINFSRTSMGFKVSNPVCLKYMCQGLEQFIRGEYVFSRTSILRIYFKDIFLKDIFKERQGFFKEYFGKCEQIYNPGFFFFWILFLEFLEVFSQDFNKNCSRTKRDIKKIIVFFKKFIASYNRIF